MLISLHVKNLALIERAEVFFGPGLNILTGETGAGKSILIGSVNLALGAKADKDMIRTGAEFGLVELIFQSEDKALASKLEEMDLPVEEDGTIIISRKIQPLRSISKINGETVTSKQVKELAEYLIDIHGQHEHQSLLHKKKHLEILDAYAGDEVRILLEEVKSNYESYHQLFKQMEQENLDETARKKELDLALFELEEITDAQIVLGEDEQLESKYRKMVHSQKIGTAVSTAYRMTGYEDESAAGSGIGRALREMRSVSSLDEGLGDLESQLLEIDGLLNDFNRDLSQYISELEFDPADFDRVESRLNVLNHLKDKYGHSLEAVFAYAEEKQKQVDKLADFELYIENLQKEIASSKARLEDSCARLSKARKVAAKSLQEILKEALEDLNFLAVNFAIDFKDKDPGANGIDDVEFLISTNPGESVKPLVNVASGGELSRIMLAIKTVLAHRDSIDTLIFDEIDAGISGKTAWKVADKLGKLGKSHQVICITHLPQIAAMADEHFEIAKSATEDSTVTKITKLSEEEALKELARLLGSDTLSQAALVNAKEMKQQAALQKSKE
ncbi:MAG: DNA repair protein RecN [Lachnospiraceae bacterium]|nr:DNA repair protein RecN [Lachnospiraceae bacterium]